MNRLREVLKKQAPELHEALERSWRIAVEEWLGTLKPSKSSYNAYPHLHNLENYLEQTLSGINVPDVECPCGNLSLVELYIVLSSILLHDIGRGTDAGNNHPEKSWEIVAEKYAHLGIPSRELAKSIGRIAAAHGRLPLPADGEKQLPTIIVDPYGEIRQELLAALLRLVDHMDSAYTRVVPLYVVPENELEILGEFRNIILGVVVDHEAHMVKTVISSEGFQRKDADVSYTIMHPYDESCKSDWIILCSSHEFPPDTQAEIDKYVTKHYPLNEEAKDVIDSQQIEPCGDTILEVARTIQACVTR